MPRLPQNLPPSIQGDSQPRPSTAWYSMSVGVIAVAWRQAEPLDPLLAAARRRPTRRSGAATSPRALDMRDDICITRRVAAPVPRGCRRAAPRRLPAGARRPAASPAAAARSSGGADGRLVDRHQDLRRPVEHAHQRRVIAAVQPAVVAERADADRLRPARPGRAAAKCARPAGRIGRPRAGEPGV